MCPKDMVRQTEAIGCDSETGKVALGTYVLGEKLMVIGMWQSVMKLWFTQLLELGHTPRHALNPDLAK